VRQEIGPIAAPDLIQFAPGLPKTRSGKIMRRILCKIAEAEYGNLHARRSGVVDDLVNNWQNTRKHVAKEIGAIAKPRQIMVVPELPKTRSGKIMRRLLKDVAEHREVGDVTTLADSTVMDLIRTKETSAPAED